MSEQEKEYSSNYKKNHDSMPDKLRANYKEKRATATRFEPSGCGFPSRFGHLNFRYWACFEQGHP